jgi:hypothetical protein
MGRMKLSTAMLKGRALVPKQGTSSMFGVRHILGQPVLDRACALGCVYIGNYPSKVRDPEALYRMDVFSALGKIYPALYLEDVVVPVTAGTGTEDLESLIINLNDRELWPVERIAEWLKSIGK